MTFLFIGLPVITVALLVVGVVILVVKRNWKVALLLMLVWPFASLGLFLALGTGIELLCVEQGSEPVAVERPRKSCPIDYYRWMDWP